MPLRVADKETIRVSGEKIEYTQETLKEYIKCKDDIIYFASKYFYIINIDKGKQLFELWPCQKRVMKAMERPPNNRRHICLKTSRQSGKTTMAACYILHYALFNEDKNIVIIANKEKTSIGILRKIKFAFSNLPKFLQQGIRDGSWNKKYIEMENGCKLEVSSTSSTAARSESINMLYVDEFAFVPNTMASDFFASIYPTLSSGITSKMIISSTPFGLNHFFEIWKKAEAGENSFANISIDWWEIPNRGEAFKQTTINDIGLVRWNQEYAAKFIGSSSTLIDGSILENIKFIEPIDVKYEGLMEIYEKPQHGSYYITGIDTAKGVGKDYSVMVVVKIIDTFNLDVVAIYSNNKIDVRSFGSICVEISKMYNNADMMIENNDIGGILCDTIWNRLEYEKIINVNKSELGIRSSKKTKLASNLIMKKYIENSFIKINNKNIIYELSRYEENLGGSFSCNTPNEHDDRVMALSWAVYFLETEYYSPENIKKASIKKDGDEEENIGFVMICDDGSDDSGWLLEKNKQDLYRDFGFAG